MLLKNFPLILLVAALGLLCGNANATDTRLPNLGSSAGQIASPEEQRQYGFYVLHELRNQSGVLDDALLTDYLNTLGYRLVSNSTQPDQAFTFFVVRDNDINAFALPGGFVGVNAGLVTTTESENELAAVLAHEISHITQNHLIRAVEAEQKMEPLMILAMIGAIAASSHQSPYSSSNSGIGAMATVQGLAAQMQINFTRQDEAEADRVGIYTLAKSGFDPDAMADFFERMQRALRPGFDENDVPALLMDHPVTTQRISEAKARADVIKKEYNTYSVSVGNVEAGGTSTSKLPCQGDHPCVGDTTAADSSATSVASKEAPHAASLIASIASDSAVRFESPQARARQRALNQAYFLLMRERVRVLASAQPAEMVTYYADNLRNHAEFNTPANRYGYALALIQAGKAKQAIEPLQKLAEAQPENLVFQIALGNAELYSGARDEALQRYVRAEKTFPSNRALALAHADALVQHGDKAAGKQAQELLRAQLSKDDEDPDLQTSFARACELAGDSVRAGEAHATAAYLNGRAEDALNQLKDISKRGDLNYYQRTRVEALIAQMTPLVLDLRRHKIKPADQGKFSATCLKNPSGLRFSAQATPLAPTPNGFGANGFRSNGYRADQDAGLGNAATGWPGSNSALQNLSEAPATTNDCGAPSSSRNN
ncbi:M48 family metalloprotease [Rudaea sp.]|jgi:predicted Zn-dependent protease|uniref:M48 family metalloprotease n=1 Tax=Rudaea sp. TaxID=2136325 RepID=UPI0039C959D1